MDVKDKETGNFRFNHLLTGLFVWLLICFIYLGCGTKMPLPPSPENVTFGSGDTTYIRLAQDWVAYQGVNLSEPCDLVVGPDGYVFVADRGNNRVAVFDRSGVPVSGYGFDRLDSLESVAAIGQDDMLNLFIATGGTKVLIWNQYINLMGVDGVLDHYVVYDTLSQDTSDMTFPEYFELAEIDPYRYVVLDAEFTDDPDSIEAALEPSVLYEDSTGHALYRGAAGGPDWTVYIADKYFDTIDRYNMFPVNMVLLSNGSDYFTFSCEYDLHVATWGSGLGTTKDPAGLYIQEQGSQHYIYFSQTDGNFLVQKIKETGEGNFSSAFDVDKDIMQLERYASPMDIWVAEQYLGNSWIFVADTDSNRVQVFNPAGEFLMYAGVRDSSGVEIFDELDHPEAVAHFQGILYVADTGNNRIIRYALSSDVENIPEP